MHVAAYYGYPKVIEILLQRGAKTAVQDRLQMTPLHAAAETRGDGKLVAQAFAQNRQYIEPESFVLEDYFNKTSLFLAVDYGHVDFFKVFEELGFLKNEAEMEKILCCALARAGSQHVRDLKYVEVIRLVLKSKLYKSFSTCSQTAASTTTTTTSEQARSWRKKQPCIWQRKKAF